MDFAGGKTDLLTGFLSGSNFMISTIPTDKPFRLPGLPEFPPPGSPFFSGIPRTNINAETATDEETQNALDKGTYVGTPPGQQEPVADSGLFDNILSAIDSFVGRLAVIILGLVFVAVGLSMFKPNAGTIVQTIKKVA